MRDIKDSGIIPYVGLGPALQEMTTQQVRVDYQEMHSLGIKVRLH